MRLGRDKSFLSLPKRIYREVEPKQRVQDVKESEADMISHYRKEIGCRHSDRGQATSILLLAMTIAILAVTMLLIRIGHANDIRTRARQAADAAALAAVTTIRNRAIAMIKINHIAPMYVPIGTDAENAAKDYAQKNGAVVTDYESGGTAVKVSVRTQECITKERGGGKFQAENPCVRTDTKKAQESNKQQTATATSAAAIELPACFSDYYPPPRQGQYVRCDGIAGAADFRTPSELAPIFKVHLSDSFDPNSGITNLTKGAPNLPPVTSAEAKKNEDLGRKLARDVKHWEGDQWNCLDNLWKGESGWNHHAKNASSGAYGIPQALPASKLATAGADWANNPATQIKWGLDYIDDRYGTPCNAWNQWNARNPHWY